MIIFHRGNGTLISSLASVHSPQGSRRRCQRCSTCWDRLPAGKKPATRRTHSAEVAEHEELPATNQINATLLILKVSFSSPCVLPIVTKPDAVKSLRSKEPHGKRGDSWGVRWFVGCMKPAPLIGGIQEWRGSWRLSPSGALYYEKWRHQTSRQTGAATAKHSASNPRGCMSLILVISWRIKPGYNTKKYNMHP